MRKNGLIDNKYKTKKGKKMKKNIILLVSLLLAMVTAHADNYSVIGKAHGQIHQEFSNMWIDKPILVSKDNGGNVLMQVGSLIINSQGKGEYQARCKLTAKEATSLIGVLNKSLSLSEKYQINRVEKTEKLAEFTDGKGAAMTGLKVYFFCRKRMENPVGSILFIKDHTDNFSQKIYVYPSQIRQLISLLEMAP